ncbi:MAG TPA: hypothetical protein VK836_01405, partial [Streptosporangiaceae bacterium]|nr:hypothetical protein [Streptosporangiaceae bacterium]
MTVTGRDGTVQDSTGQDDTVLDSTVQDSTVQDGTVQDGTVQDSTGVRAAAGAAVQRVSQTLLARQDGRGWWSGRSAGDVTLEAEALLVAEVLGIRTAQLTSAAAQQIRS